VPDGRDPKAARVRIAKPPAGTALAPHSGSHREHVPYESSSEMGGYVA
jgi:hypothetical protein